MSNRKAKCPDHSSNDASNVAPTALVSSSSPSSISSLTHDVESIHKRYDRSGPHTVLLLPIVNLFSSVIVIITRLIGLDAILSMGLSAGLTVYVYNATEDQPTFDGGVMSWTLLTFAVVTPLSASVGMAFSRREKALAHLKSIRSAMMNSYLAHASWDWPNRGQPQSGRQACTVLNSSEKTQEKVDWVAYGDDVLNGLLTLAEELSMMLLLPTFSRARHKVLPKGRQEAHNIHVVSERIHKSLIGQVATLSAQCEYLKLQGLPGNEASRIRQWEQFILDGIEGLRMIKSYRTPQALRSYSRLLSVVIPPLFCPYYADLARSTGSLLLGILYSILTAVALSGLFDCVAQLEDPFFGHTSLDGVNVHEELGTCLYEQLLLLRAKTFPNAAPFKRGSKQ